MLRRQLLLAIGACVVGTPSGVFAQPAGKVWRVGFLTPQRRPESLQSGISGAFLDGMRELGYVEGKNLAMEWRFAEDQFERLPGLAAELVAAKVDVIVTIGVATSRAVQKATTTIPIVLGSVNDPVGTGLVKSLARPGGNITGLSNVARDVSPKQLEMLQAVAPKLSYVAVLLNPTNSSHAGNLEAIEQAARVKGVRILSLQAATSSDVEKALATMGQKKAQGLIVMRDTFLQQQLTPVAKATTGQRIPSVAGVREYVEAGGLMSYGVSLRGNFRRAATYVDKILRGAKPADLPVEQPTKLELVINRGTAKALGLSIPQSLLAMADEVI